MNVGFITGIWQRREPHFLPRDGMGAGSSWRPWAGAMGWGCQAEPLHSPTAELGPLLPLPENHRLESRAGFPRSPMALLERMAWPFGPCHLRPPVLLPWPLSMETGWVWAKAASRQPTPVLGVTESHLCHCGVG